MQKTQLATETEQRYLTRETRLNSTSKRVASRPSKLARQLLLDTALSKTIALKGDKQP